MQLALNIEHFAKPVVNETRLIKLAFIKLAFIDHILKFLVFLQNRIKKNLHKDIDNLILVVEGFYSHSKKLTPLEAELLLKSIKRVILKIDKLDENMQEINYLRDDQLKEKFKYMLKSLYKIESIVHKEVYKNVSVEKTPEEILNGTSEMNNLYLSKILTH